MNIVFDLELFLRRIRQRIGVASTVSVNHPAEVDDLLAIDPLTLESAAARHGLRVVPRMDRASFEFMRRPGAATDPY